MKELRNKIPLWLQIILSCLGLAITYAAGYLGTRSGVSFCGPETYGPPCSIENIGYLLLLALGVFLYLWAGGLGLLSLVPIVWLASIFLNTAIIGGTNTGFLIGSTILGIVALIFFIYIDVLRFVSKKRNGIHQQNSKEEKLI